MASQPRRYVSNPTLFTIDEQSTGRFQRDASLRYARGPNNSNVPNASSMDVEKCLVGPNHVDLVLKDGRTCRVQLSNQSENLDIIVRDNEKVSHAVGQWHQRMYRHEHQYHQHQHHHHPQHSSSQHNLQSIPKYHQYQAAQQQHMQQQPGHGLPWNAYNNKQLPVNKFPSSGVVVGSCQDYNGLLNRHLSRSYNAVNRLPSIDQDPLESTDSMVCAFASVATVYSTLDKQLKKPSNQELGPAKQHTAAPSSSSASKGKPLGDPASRPHHRQQGAATGVKKRNSLHDSSSSASSASSADSQTINYSPGAVAEGQHFLRIDHGDHCSGCCPDRGDHLYETIYPSGPTGIIMTGQQLDQVHKCNDSGVVSVSSDDGCSAKDVIMSASESCFDDGHPELHDDDDDDDGAVEREEEKQKEEKEGAREDGIEPAPREVKEALLVDLSFDGDDKGIPVMQLTAYPSPVKCAPSCLLMNALCNLELTSSGLLSEVILPTPSAESIVHNEPSQQQLAAIVEPGSTGVTSGDTERQQWAEDLAAAEKKVRLLEDKVKIFERDRKATDECMKEFDKLMKERNGELDLARQECKLHLDSATLSAKQLKSTQEDNRRLQDKMAAVNTRSKILRDKLRTVKKEKKLADERIKELEKFMEVFLF